MADSPLDAAFRDVSRESLEADAAVCFILDQHLQLIYCNPAWDQFALRNGAPHLLAERVLGVPVLLSTTGQLFDYYRSLYLDALADGKPRDHDFHCSSPDCERLMRMHVYRLRSTRALLIRCSIRVEQDHRSASGEPLQSCYRNPQGLIVMCGNCRRTRRAGVEPETWDWVSEFVRHQPPRVSHGICGLCMEYYYPVEA